jgi:hypothetical protein
LLVICVDPFLELFPDGTIMVYGSWRGWAAPCQAPS